MGHFPFKLKYTTPEFSLSSNHRYSNQTLIDKSICKRNCSLYVYCLQTSPFTDKDPFYQQPTRGRRSTEWPYWLKMKKSFLLPLPSLKRFMKSWHEIFCWTRHFKKISVDSLETNWTSHERLEMEICMTTVYTDILKFTKLWASGFFQAPSLANWHKLPL